MLTQTATFCFFELMSKSALTSASFAFVEAFAYLIGGQADVLAAGAKFPETRDVRDDIDVTRVDFPRRGNVFWRR